MLTPESYHAAWLVYIAATAGALIIFYFWLGPRYGAIGRIFVCLLLAGLALAPAHPSPDTNTWAPAIFVMGFDLLIDGVEAAARSLRPLLIAEAMALAACIVVYLARSLFHKG